MKLFKKAATHPTEPGGPPTTVTVRDRVFALGLAWSDADSLAAAAELARAERAAFIYNAPSKRVGLSPASTHDPGIISAAAAALSNVPAATWLSFQPLPSSGGGTSWYWLLVVRHGRVERDEVMSAVDALAVAARLETADEWEVVYADAYLHLAHAQQQRLDILLRAGTKSAQLRRAGRFTASGLSQMSPAQLGKAGLAIGLFAVGVYVYFWNHASPPPLVRPDLIKTAAEEAQARRAKAAAEQPVHPIVQLRALPTVRPDPKWFAETCEAELGILVSALAGAPLGSATCMPPTASSKNVWSATVTSAGGGVLSATASLIVDPAAVIPDAPSGLRPSSVVAYLREALKPANISVAPAKAAASPLVPSANAAEQPTDPADAPGDVELKTSLAPATWSAPLARLPVNIRSLSFSPSGGWTYTLRPRSR